MSNTVSIKPVKESDLKNLVETDNNISLETHDEYISVKYTKKNQAVVFDYSNHEISFLGTPSNFEMSMLQKLALKLNAKVIGENGEDLTGVKDVEVGLEGCGATFYTLIGLILSLTLYWMFVE